MTKKKHYIFIGENEDTMTEEVIGIQEGTDVTDALTGLIDCDDIVNRYGDGLYALELVDDERHYPDINVMDDITKDDDEEAFNDDE